MEELYNMAIHEETMIATKGKDISILRVPGGWIYTFTTNYVGYEPSDHSVFVPYRPITNH